MSDQKRLMSEEGGPKLWFDLLQGQLEPLLYNGCSLLLSLFTLGLFASFFLLLQLDAANLGWSHSGL